jgi:peptide subunit release factor 1 (eRF1)
MISRDDILHLIRRPGNGHPVLSVFLDMSVNSENKRTHEIFLSQQKNRFAELDSDRPGHHREALGEAFARVEKWLGSEYQESNRGLALYLEVGGPWLAAYQFPVAVRNRIAISDVPVIGPLATLVEGVRRYAVLLIDREHMRTLVIELGRVVAEHEISGDPYPTRHDVKAGGYSAKDFQKRKAEEVRHFWKEFAQEVVAQERRYSFAELIVLGTEENTSRFQEFLPQALRERVVHTGHAPVAAPAPSVLERLKDFFAEESARRELETVQLLQDRVRNRHFAVAGFPPTLEQLQEGKVQTLVLARDIERSGARCLSCGFVLDGGGEACPYCGGHTQDGVDLVEAMLQLAAEKDVGIEFADRTQLDELNGVGALLRF